MYAIENYKGTTPFNEQYDEIYEFLLGASDRGLNEHFHWGRFEWMMDSGYLAEDKLTTIAMFRNSGGGIVGLVTYDTGWHDRTYLIHSENDKELLKEMVAYVLRTDEQPMIKVNSLDAPLCEVLREMGFEKKHTNDHVLQIALDRDLHYNIPEGYKVGGMELGFDLWKCQLVLHKGFDHEDEGLPQPLDPDTFVLTPHADRALKVFAMDETEYCAHCGLWYTKGETAYIEPVVTIPRCRRLGLGRAVIYEAISRAKRLGAKRAVVLSQQEFYYRIGLEYSSEFCTWEPKAGNLL